MMRLNYEGNIVTDERYRQSIDDLELTRTQYNHPSITSGMHTNGPSSIWVRKCYPDSEWVELGRTTSEHKVRLAWMSGGWDAVMAMSEVTHG